MKLIKSTSTEAFLSYDLHPDLGLFDAHQIIQDKVDLQLICVSNEQIIGFCSLWWSDTANYLDKTAGNIGHYRVLNQKVSDLLLNSACELLKQHGCDWVIGPLDGCSWRSYRFVTQKGHTRPPFLFEPWQADEWVDYWRGCGFNTLATYYSYYFNNFDVELPPKVLKAQQRLQHIQLRSMNVYQDDLTLLYEMAKQSFKANFLYTELTLDDFLHLYVPLEKYLDKDLFLIAEDQGQAVGFLLGIPDALQLNYQQNISTVLLKTFAQIPQRKYLGLGTLMGVEFNQRVLDKGYQDTIHALIYAKNNSLNLSRHTGATRMRSYELLYRSV